LSYTRNLKVLAAFRFQLWLYSGSETSLPSYRARHAHQALSSSHPQSGGFLISKRVVSRWRKYTEHLIADREVNL